MFSFRFFALGVLLLVASCREQGLVASLAALRADPLEVDFGNVYVGGVAERTVSLLNTGRRDLHVSWEGLEAPFEGEAPELLPAGETSLLLRFRPSAPGVAQMRLVARYDLEELALTVRGESSYVPDCPKPVSCQQARFDLAEGRCIESVLPDGTACDTNSVCVEGGTCQAGRCVGTPRSCDDDNLCTVDLCNAVTGCEHVPAPPCPGDGRCQTGVCDPKTGCGFAPATDGTVCGQNVSCDLADVCISGQCVTRDPPDGFICAPASPCQAAGTCAGSVCQRPPATPLLPNWSFDALTDASRAMELHDLVLEPDGRMSLSGFFEVPKIRANSLGAMDGISPARRCILWNARLLCADYPTDSSGKVSAIDMATGALVWTFDLPGARPDFAALTSPGRLFMARLAALGTDRLAALFEAFPANTDFNTQCRMYFLVVLDAAGKMITAQRVEDAFLDVCSHPHPFGVVSDAQGQLFIAFSHSEVGSAPLVPKTPSLLASYSRDGVLRWKRIEEFVGGELASARGLIYPEKSGTAHSAATGAPYRLADLPNGVIFGRIVATGDRVIPSPHPDTKVLSGYEQGSGWLRWQYFVPQGTFISDQVRLASWKSSSKVPAETVALVFTERVGQPALTAINARTGLESWTCDVSHSYRSAPQLFEVANGSIALMEGAEECGKCDPSYAQSHAGFHSFGLNGIEIAKEPWLGTFGGAGHDHAEDFVPAIPLRPQ